MAKDKTDTKIDVRRFRGVLLENKVPYTATTSSPFDVEDYIQDIENVESEKRTTFKYAKDQLDMWTACHTPGEPLGWSALFSGQSDIAKVDSMAAQLCGLYIGAGKTVKWCNLTATKWSDKFMRDEILGGTNPNRRLDLLVLSGLRWDSDFTRYDKAYDLMRMAPDRCNRILVGVGENPIAFSRSLGLPVSRVAYLQSYKETNL